MFHFLFLFLFLFLVGDKNWLVYTMNNMPSHHPDQERLVDYSAGRLHEAGSLILATHLALCPTCRTITERLEDVGGVMLSSLPPSSLETNALAVALSRLDEPEPEPTIAPLPRLDNPEVPTPLSDYLGCGYDSLKWKRSFGGVSELVLEPGDSPIKTFLLKMEAGRKLPVHTHRGREITLVLKGAYTDHMGEFRAGDYLELDQSVTHQPVITDEGDCICLAVTDAPLRFTRGLARLLNPFLTQ